MRSKAGRSNISRIASDGEGVGGVVVVAAERLELLHDRIDGRLWVRALLRGGGARDEERGGDHGEERQPSEFHDPG